MASYSFYFPAGIGILALLWRLSAEQISILKGSAMSPVSALLCLILIALIDFSLALIDSDRIVYLRGAVIPISNEFAVGAFAFWVIIAMLCIGVLVTGTIAIKYNCSGSRLNKIRAHAREICFWPILALAIIVSLHIINTGSAQNNLFYVSMLRGQYYRDYPLSWLTLSLMVPAFLFWSERYPLKSPILSGITLIVGTIILLGSTRSQLVILAVWFSLRLIRSGIRIKFIYILPIVVIIPLAASYLQYLQRDSTQFRSYAEMLDARGGIFGQVFGTADVAFAEAISLVEYYQITQPPFNSFWAAVTLPIPREIFPDKPIPPSTLFTMTVDPTSWENSQSELVMSGITNLYVEFGWYSIGVAFVLGSIWSLAVRRASHVIITTGNVMPCVYTIWIAFAFLRNDLFNISFVLWPLAIYSTIFWAVTSILKLRQWPRPQGIGATWGAVTSAERQYCGDCSPSASIGK